MTTKRHDTRSGGNRATGKRQNPGERHACRFAGHCTVTGGIAANRTGSARGQRQRITYHCTRRKRHALAALVGAMQASYAAFQFRPRSVLASPDGNVDRNQ